MGTRRAEAVRPWARHLLLAPDTDPELQDAGVQFPLTLRTRGGAHPTGAGRERGESDPGSAVSPPAEVTGRREDF